MHTKHSLMEQLKAMDIESQGTILVHSSMKRIGDVEGGADTVLDALSEYMKEGLLVLPTHTWASVNASNPRYDVEETASCVGILSEMFRKRADVVRSWHPTHSVAAKGADAAAFTTGEERFTTPTARGSVWGKLLDRQAQILLIGADLTKNTFIHGIEEWNGIKGRIGEQPVHMVTVTPDGREIDIPMHTHVGTDVSRHYGKLEELLDDRGAIRRGRFGDAEVIICNTVWMTELISSMLEADPDLFTTDEPLKEEIMARYQLPNVYA